MKIRKIIKIDEAKCDGCGLCIPNCPEGALRVIDGKARLVSDLLCDGLGACLGECPRGAITVEERAAAAYDEAEVMKNMLPLGMNTVKAHLAHLKSHGQDEYLSQALENLKKQGIENPLEKGEHMVKSPCGCPGAKTMTFTAGKGEEECNGGTEVRSRLRQWPVQLRLVSPSAPYFKKADVVLAADCAAYAFGDFHNRFLKGKALAIACPKLDEDHDSYIEKLTALFDAAGINTLTVITMEVPCCGGLMQMAQTALSAARRKVPVKQIVIGLQGEIKSEEWV
jgi:Pyruvate/2-oxoacid:ferredoxin oxidoreductase delta subunit